MSFYSYKNANVTACPGRIQADPSTGLNEKVCVQVKKVYDSCLQQEQLDKTRVTVTSLVPVPCNPCGCGTTPCTCQAQTLPAITPPICFESCRSSSTTGVIRNLSIDRLCDRPCFARVRCLVDIPIDILFVDSQGVEGIGRSTVTITKDVIMSIPDESIVPFTLETLCSAICVTGTYVGNNQFDITICVTVILKILAEVEILIPSYGYCPIPPCEDFAENVCDEFFSLPIFPFMQENPNGCAPSCGCGRIGCGCAQGAGCNCAR